MITVPPSVLAYHQQPDVTMAVDLLLDADKSAKTARASKSPIAKLGWNDVAPYYRACLAAHQTRAEFALLLEALWRAIWRDAPPSWCPLEPGDQREDMAIDVHTVWYECCFSRGFKKGSYALELSVYLEARGEVQLGIALWDGDENLLQPKSLTDWEQEDSGYFWTESQIVPLGEVIDPAAFQPWAEQAWTATAAALAESNA